MIVKARSDELTERVAALAHDETMEVDGGTVAVVTLPSLMEDLAAALEAKGVPFSRADRQGIEAPVTLIPVSTVKGLEFDSVVVVEPAGIVSGSAQGLRSLYVALTRATRRLTIVHAEPLPDALASGVRTLPVRSSTTAAEASTVAS